MKITKTSIAALALAAGMIMPMAASAHGLELNGHGSLGAFLGLGHKSEVRADAGASLHKEDGTRDKDGHEQSATSSAKLGAKITAQGVRIQNTADFFGALSPTLSQKITSSTLSASSSAAAQAKLTDYNAKLAGAKTNAQAAVVLGGTIASSTGTTTDLAAQARADLKAARDFLHQARQDLIAIVHTLWGIATRF